MVEQQNETADAGSKSNPVTTAIAVVVGAITLVIGLAMLAQFALSTRSLGSGHEKANSPEAIAMRISHPVSLAVEATKGSVPVVAVAPAAPAASPAITAAAVPVVAAATPVAATDVVAKVGGGENLYKTSCFVCHGAGVAGAPKSGDKGAWAPRIAQGKDTLYKHAIGGYQGKSGMMPAKGGNTSIPDADVKSAVDYMVSLSK